MSHDPESITPSAEDLTPQPGHSNRWQWRVIAVFGGLLIASLLAEGIVRVFALGPPVYAPRRFKPDSGVPFVQIPNGPLAYRPDSVFSSVYDPSGDERGYFGESGRVTYRLNRYGMRGPDWSEETLPDHFRVVCLGDSITFGEGVRIEDTYPARLERGLSALLPNRHVEVINAGVQGYGTLDEIAFYLLRCARFKPDVVTLGFFLNDATRSQETIRQNEARTRAWKPSGLSAFSRVWEILSRRRAASLLQAEYFATTRAGFASSGWEDCKEALRGMKRISREDGFRFVVVVFPILWELDGAYPFEDLHTLIADACREYGIEHIDLLDTCRGRRAESLWVHPTDQHPNEIAHRLAAERITRHLVDSKK
ncbi:MAG: SGNH/GDSL hydrolase family protein [Phycisphaerae bacterium]